MPDNQDELPLDPTETKDFDSDGTGDNADPDDDNDGVNDDLDLWPFDSAESSDNDTDGIGDNADPDDDNDTMSDTFENQYGLNRFDPSDADQDLDNDGFTNLEEFNNGTDPTASPASRDLITGTDGGGGGSIGLEAAGLLLFTLLVCWRRRQTGSGQLLTQPGRRQGPR